MEDEQDYGSMNFTPQDAQETPCGGDDEYKIVEDERGDRDVRGLMEYIVRIRGKPCYKTSVLLRMLL